MLRNYFKTAIRNIFRNKVFSTITILGLSGGLTCAMLILTFVSDEFSYDEMHSRKSDIYRLRYKIQNFDLARVPPIFKENLNEFFPEIEASTRLFSRSVSVNVGNNASSPGGLRFEENNVNFSDPELFRIFDFELVDGTLSEALEKPFTAILNEEVAQKYFGSGSAVGQSIQLGGMHSFQVVAVVKDFPTNSHVHFDMLLPYDNMYDLEPPQLAEGIRANFKRNWIVSHSPTYVVVEPGTDIQLLNKRFADFVEEKIPENMKKGQAFEFQPLLDIHLNNDVQAQAEAPGDLNFIIIFLAVGFLTLLIACINFVNLSTAKSLERAREIGVRKVMGAWKSSLVYQFLGESMIITMFAAFLAVGFTVLLLPQLNSLTDKTLTIASMMAFELIAGFSILVILTALLAGIYPSFFVTRISPVLSLKGITSQKQGGELSFRRGLIVIQFAISIMLISGAIIVFDQLDNLRNKDLGFGKDFVITAPVQSANFNNVFGGVDEGRRQKMNAFEESLKAIPGIKNSTVSSTTLGFGSVNRNIVPEGFTAEDNIIAPVMAVDYDFLETYEITLIEGRNFSKDFGTDQLNAFVLNEKALEAWEFGSPVEAIGKNVNMEGKEGKVIGVVRDFNFLSLATEIQPLLMEINVAQFTTFSFKLNGANVPQTLDQIEQQWNSFFPDQTFDYSFLDESLAQIYNSQERFGSLIGYFAFMAIIISCLGSYGLIMYVANGKRKEIGIRKVLGASVLQVVFLLSKKFFILVALSIIIAIPITIYAANQWLEEFSYQVGISPMSFVAAALGTILLVLTTVSAQSLKAAIANPVKSLRSE
ncbi:MAG: ABC transporter permease [Cytophagales bacterium]|nr:ABC transporter permease [Cytophagales bacterium]